MPKSDNEKVILAQKVTLRVHLRAQQTVAINDKLCKYNVVMYGDMMMIGVEIAASKEISVLTGALIIC